MTGTGSALEREIRREAEHAEKERKASRSSPLASQQKSRGAVTPLSTEVEERCKTASRQAARVAAGAGSQGQKSAVKMLQRSFKGQKRASEVERLVQKHQVATGQAWVLDALWLLIDEYGADPPWPGVIVEILRGVEQHAAPQILAAFTELLAGWVEVKTKEVEEEAMSKATQVFVYDKLPLPLAL